jgi:uncharacterized membrane protein
MVLLEHIETVGNVMDAAGVVAIALGGAVAAGIALGRLLRRTGNVYRVFREQFGRAILLGLELLVAADIIRTVAVTPNAENVAVLAGIVGIRTFLSFSLGMEMTGRWPWQQAPRRSSTTPSPGDPTPATATHPE